MLLFNALYDSEYLSYKITLVYNKKQDGSNIFISMENTQKNSTSVPSVQI